MAKKSVIFEDKAGLGDRLAKARKKAGLTQVYVADYIGVSQASVGRWEKGQDECSLGALNKLSVLYNESLDYLITGQRVSEALEVPQWLRPHLASLRALNEVDQGRVLGALQLLGLIKLPEDSKTLKEDKQAVAGMPRSRDGTR